MNMHVSARINRLSGGPNQHKDHVQSDSSDIMTSITFSIRRC